MTDQTKQTKQTLKNTNDIFDQEEPAHLIISKINNSIYLGSFENAYEPSDEFKALKIDVIINCAIEVEYPEQSDYIVENFPIRDGDSLSFLENMDRANDKIHYYLSRGKKIYLHCVRGVSRSPAILVYYLMSHKKFTYDRAVRLLKKMRPVICINEEFETQLRLIEEC